jgi:hypothetical protein
VFRNQQNPRPLPQRHQMRNSTPPRTWFNYELDTLHLVPYPGGEGLRRLYIRDAFEYFSQDELDNIQQMSSVLFARWYSLEKNSEQFYKFKCLKRVFSTIKGENFSYYLKQLVPQSQQSDRITVSAFMASGMFDVVSPRPRWILKETRLIWCQKGRGTGSSGKRSRRVCCTKVTKRLPTDLNCHLTRVP